jgi:hypothetical protein
MAKSIRVSDGIYELAAAAGDAVNRSLADQIEYWARIGAALDAAGITMEQALAILGGHERLKERVIAHVMTASRGARRKVYSGDPSIASRLAKLNDEVAHGSRAPESLLLLGTDRVKSAKFTFADEGAGGARGW